MSTWHTTEQRPQEVHSYTPRTKASGTATPLLGFQASTRSRNNRILPLGVVDSQPTSRAVGHSAEQ